jgi:hypothetical protein
MKRTIFAVLIAAAVTAACGQVSPAGLVQAARLDPLETPPNDIFVAVGVPQSIQMRSGDASLYLGFQPNVGDLVEATVPLARLENQIPPMPSRADQAVYVFGFAPDDADLLAQTQAQIRNLKAGGIDGTGTLSVLINGGCYVGELNDALLASTWLKTNPQAQFTQMTRSTSLFDMLDAASSEAIKSGLVPC